MPPPTFVNSISHLHKFGQQEEERRKKKEERRRRRRRREEEKRRGEGKRGKSDWRLLPLDHCWRNQLQGLPNSSEGSSIAPGRVGAVSDCQDEESSHLQITSS
ncbi:uncharacterized protein LOC122090045 isoform X2 [Macadamia integrifolia]|uniref:uncharacterized protein LOC122090045 isoform X2 n=1 Tax=Macadamia integrifolia TaxID=60698 RepID=UPI001C4F8E31|nr:uncharacterized protein LOC122090045 isoform X2 [Macadamia integrifolia]